MIPEAVLCYPTTSVVEAEVVDEGGYSADHHPSKLYDDVLEASFGGGATGSAPQLRFLLYSLSSLKQKVDQVESLLVSSIIFTTSQECPNMPVPTHTAVPFATVGTLVQEIVVTASSMMFNCQQMNLLGSPPQTGNNNNNTIYNNPNNNNDNIMESNDINNNNEGSYYSTWYEDDEGRTCSKNRTAVTSTKNGAWKRRGGGKKASLTAETYDLMEPEAEDLVAKYTHYCKICGKGFKRDANLRMHMRAHGDEYKSSTALSNPLKKEEAVPQEASNHPRKYSCPQVGCRWNKNHVRFQPLKSIICVKNHYKRSHCPKMYMCKRCNKKQFSVLSDLRTHEKHCGDREWQCSCGTTFSRKDKLMGHVALFIGHTPLVNPLASW